MIELSMIEKVNYKTIYTVKKHVLKICIKIELR